MGRDLISVAKPFLRSRGPSGPPPSGKSGKPEAPQIDRDLISVAKPFLRSRGPSGP